MSKLTVAGGVSVGGERVYLVDKRWGNRPCIIEPGCAVSYAELDALIEATVARFERARLAPGDRIGICARRSADVVAICVAAYRAGLTYVCADPNAPVARNVAIHTDCGVRIAFVEERFADAYESGIAELGSNVVCERLENIGGGSGLSRLLETPVREVGSGAQAPVPGLLHLLYTSGSTGKPKGVMLSRENIKSFIDWARDLVLPTPDDRFGNHAQFHFGISTFDLFLSLSSGSALVIVPDEVGRHPEGLLTLLQKERVTVWYSTPRILALMAQTGKVGQYDLSSLRILAFAGEPFPIQHFNCLRDQLPHPRYFHMYGSTETNIMAYFEVPADASFDTALPIGRTAEYYESRVVDTDGRDVAVGEDGEYLVRGPGLMSGYWNQPELTRERQLRADDGVWHRTGDVLRRGADGTHLYVGRADRMVKRAGYRIELAEVERALAAAPDVREAAVTIVRRDGEIDLRAHVVVAGTPSVLRIKQSCAVRVPAYMIPDEFNFLRELPRTSTNKIDYQALMQMTQ